MQAVDVKRGNVIKYEGELWQVLDTQQTFTGKRGAYIQFKLQRLKDDHIETKRFSSSEELEKVFLEQRKMQYLYQDRTDRVFMDLESGEQVSLDEEKLEDVLPYLAYNAEVQLSFCNGEAVSVALPPSVVLEVVKAEPAVRGNTATGVTKPVELETGLTIKVPAHVRQGDRVKVDTRTAEFIGRA